MRVAVLADVSDVTAVLRDISVNVSTEQLGRVTRFKSDVCIVYSAAAHIS